MPLENWTPPSLSGAQGSHVNIEVWPLMDGWTAEYELRSCARNAQISWPEWLRMSEVDRAMEIASQQAKHLIEIAMMPRPSS